MSRSLAFALAFTDVAFLLYWAVSAVVALGWAPIPADWLFADYHDRRVVAWNWSFLPLDLAFSITGLLAVRAARRSLPNWRILAIISLVLSSTAGGMAITYWIILREFDPFWFVPNLILFAWPLFYLPGLMRTAA